MISKNKKQISKWNKNLFLINISKSVKFLARLTKMCMFCMCITWLWYMKPILCMYKALVLILVLQNNNNKIEKRDMQITYVRNNVDGTIHFEC